LANVDVRHHFPDPAKVCEANTEICTTLSLAAPSRAFDSPASVRTTMRPSTPMIEPADLERRSAEWL